MRLGGFLLIVVLLASIALRGRGRYTHCREVPDEFARVVHCADRRHSEVRERECKRIHLSGPHNEV